MDECLLESIEESVKREKMQCDFIDADDAVELVESLASNFSFDLNKLFLWSSEKFREVYVYQEDRDRWCLLMENLLNEFNEKIFLVITDEEFFPWNVLKCRKKDCIKLLKAQRYFEYFIFDASLSCVLFDTHDNSFMIFKSGEYAVRS